MPGRPPTSELASVGQIRLAPGACIATGDSYRGTLGCFLKDGTGNTYLLTNYHVLAAGGASSGATVFALPRFDADFSEAAVVGRFSGEFSMFGPEGDVALARIREDVLPLETADGWPRPLEGTRPPRHGELVHKVGAATAGVRYGTVDRLNTTEISYLDGGADSAQIACFRISGPAGFCRPGDSGSVWIGEDGMAVGLHFAGRDGTSAHAFACDISRIVASLGMNI